MRPTYLAIPCNVKRMGTVQWVPQLQVFEKLWGTNELLSSFDSINCLPPSSATGAPNDQTSWLHADQAPLRRGFYCIQVSCSFQHSATPRGFAVAWPAFSDQVMGFGHCKQQVLGAARFGATRAVQGRSSLVKGFVFTDRMH